MYQASLIDAPARRPAQPQSPPPPCSVCQHLQAHPNPISGRYNLRCAHCAARLVRSARPLRGPQEALLTAIQNVSDAPSRDLVLQTLRALDALDAQDAAPAQSKMEQG